MSYKRLKLLIELVSILSDKEFVNLKHYLGSYHSKNGAYEPKTLRIVNLVRKDSSITYDTLKKKISPNSAVSVFDVLIYRLYKKAIDSLSLQVNTSNKVLYTDIVQKTYELKRQLMGARILAGKGLYLHALKLFDKVVFQAEKLELFDIYTEAIYQKMNYYSMDGNRKGVQECADLIDTNAIKEKYIMKAKTYYHLDFIGEGWKLHGDQEETLLRKLNEIQGWLIEAPTALLEYWFKIMQLNYFEFKKRTTESLKLSLELIEFLNSNTCVAYLNRLSIAHIHVAHNFIELYRFDDAATYAKTAFSFTKNPTQRNYQLALEYLFQAKFHARDYSGAYVLINNLIDGDSESKFDLSNAKRYYFRACVHFIQGQFKKSLHDLGETTALNKDREGWNLNIRILSIVNFIELQKLDLADTAIKNLYQLIHAVEKEQIVRKRYKLIYQCLKILSEEGFRFKQAKVKIAPLLTILSSDEKDCSPIVLQPEFIAFEKWLKAKVGIQITTDFAVSFAA